MKLLRAFFFLPLLWSCQSEPELVQMTNQGPAQGSTFSISYLVPEGVDYRIDIDSILKSMDQQMSLWVEDSEISRLNEGESIYLSNDFHGLILRSLHLSDLTGGAFDITIAPLIKAWGFSGGTHNESVNLDSLMSFVGYEGLISRRPGPMMEKYTLPRGYELDVNAIAQGYTVDVVSNFFRNQNVQNYMIEIGGEVRCKGKNLDGRLWRIGIEQPQEERVSGQYQTIVELDSMSLATSGNYRKYWLAENGQRVVHTIDPTSGQPVVSNLLSVSIIAQTATEADALATACMVKGLEESKAMIERFANTEGYFIVGNKYGEFEVQTTSNWSQYELN
ncbi:MAG: FAD:protein FMN transferase [Schleiferiaceae bacterium]|nr:FAD:protein FMN transferase [Schleiferiaceae bacterium]